ncbi:hypothetical protein IHQ71_18670 [Rhizobium sp. TH2]|uniref:hypothetical protein n=1 Tax=Rhizobium sp. TH2 TaxID=2775403 RepID=UPI0021575E2F|nr:hypothetical protein [Rhizobium sp. TH2]UVC07231.1 hypothetical protein IHQ71_18670 [Rhizobium sp. TH2]
MGQYLTKYRRRKQAKEMLERVDDKRDNTLIIHYSCESFYDVKDGRTPRITSIAIRFFASGNTESFSIHKSAELNGVPFAEIEQNYDTLERKMLDEFFKFIERHHNYIYVHWNMRDINYGFQALEHRHKVLGGTPVAVADASKLDMPRILIAIYGPGFAAHGKSGRLHTLLDLNSIKTKDVLNGAQEAEAFQQKEYVKLHQSTLKKVDVIDNLLDRFLDGSLKTQARWRDTHSLHPAILVEVIQEHWLFSLLGFVALILGIMAVFFPQLLAFG